jgi:hypothetical protein
MSRPVLKSLLALAAAASLLALGGCASGPAARAEFDRSVDFTQYKSFAFASPLGTDRGGYQTIVSQHLKAATQRELEARGLRLVASAPQLLVNFNAQLNEKLRVTTLPAMGAGFGGGYYGYRGGLYATWPMYRDETVVTPYNEGTLNIDLVDTAARQMVWEGVVVGSVTQKSVDNLQASIDIAVAAAFGKFPIAAPAAAAK